MSGGRSNMGSMGERLMPPRNTSGQAPSEIDRRVAVLLERAMHGVLARVTRLEQRVAQLEKERAGQ